MEVEGIDMGTGDVPVKSILLKERSKIELYSEIRWSGDQINQKNTFPTIDPTPEASNNCVCFNIGAHNGSTWIPMSFKHDDIDSQPVQ